MAIMMLPGQAGCAQTRADAAATCMKGYLCPAVSSGPAEALGPKPMLLVSAECADYSPTAAGQAGAHAEVPGQGAQGGAELCQLPGGQRVDSLLPARDHWVSSVPLEPCGSSQDSYGNWRQILSRDEVELVECELACRRRTLLTSSKTFGCSPGPSLISLIQSFGTPPDNKSGKFATSSCYRGAAVQRGLSTAEFQQASAPVDQSGALS